MFDVQTTSRRPLRDVRIVDSFAIFGMHLGPLRFLRAQVFCCFGLCDREGLRIDLVSGLERVPPDRRHSQLGVGFVAPEIRGRVLAEETLHGAKALLDAKAPF